MSGKNTEPKNASWSCASLSELESSRATPAQHLQHAAAIRYPVGVRSSPLPVRSGLELVLLLFGHASLHHIVVSVAAVILPVSSSLALVPTPFAA